MFNPRSFKALRGHVIRNKVADNQCVIVFKKGIQFAEYRNGHSGDQLHTKHEKSIFSIGQIQGML